MSDYKTFFLHKKEFRYFNDTRIDFEFRNIKDDWRPIAICDKGIYKQIQFKFSGKQYGVLLHRIIYFVNNPDWNIDNVKQEIDHIIHKKDVPLDNSITNLRCGTHQQNLFNKNGLGYSWDKSRNKWLAQIGIDGKRIYLGHFVKEQDAENAHKAAKLIIHII